MVGEVAGMFRGKRCDRGKERRWSDSVSWRAPSSMGAIEAPPQNICHSTPITPRPSSYNSSVYALSRRLRVGWRSFRSALASIWRMRSRVTLKNAPTSSRVR